MGGKTMSNQLLMRRRANIAKKEEIPCVKFTAMEDGCDVTLGKVGSPTTGVFEYAINGTTFLPYTVGDLVQLDEGDVVRFRRPEGSSITTLNESPDSRYYRFATNGEIVCDAMPTALLTCDGKVTSVVNYCFYNLFNTTHDGLTINITVPDGVVSCGILSFAKFGSVASFSFTNSIIKFYEGANTFNYAVFDTTQIEKVFYKGSIDDWCDIVFGNNDSNPIWYLGQLYINGVLLENAVISRVNQSTFYNASCLKTIQFEGYTKNSIPYGAFYNCKNLRGNIIIPEGVEIISDDVFNNYGKNVQSNNTLTLPNSLTTLGTRAFYNANITGDLTIPSGVSIVPKSCFAGTKFNGKLTLESGVTEIDNNALCCNFKEIYLSNTLTKIGNSSFKSNSSFKCDVIHLYGDNITSIDEYNYFNCIDLYYYGNILSLCSANINRTSSTYCNNFYVNDVLTIELTIDSDIQSLNTWIPCKKPLTKIRFNGNVTNCNNYSFSYCSNLRQVIFTQQTPPVVSGNISLYNTNNSIKFYIPYSADHSVLAAYQAASGWSAVASKIYELDENGDIPS